MREAYVPMSGLTHRHPEGDGWREHNHLAGGVPHQHDPVTGGQIPVFTPEAVKAVLLGAGFTESSDAWGVGPAGFHVADGRDQWGCILVEHRVGQEFKRLDGLRHAERIRAYRTVLRENGFQADVERGQVLVTGLQGADR